MGIQRLGGRVDRAGRLLGGGVALLAVLAAVLVPAAGAAPAASPAKSALPAGCAGAINFCFLLSPTADGHVVLTYASMPNANEPPVTKLEFETGKPTSVLAPRKLCHSAGTVRNADGQEEDGGQPLTYRTICNVYAKVGHPVLLCLTSAAPILGGTNGVPPPNNPGAPAGQWLGPPVMGGYFAKTIGSYAKCPLKAIALEHKAPR